MTHEQALAVANQLVGAVAGSEAMVWNNAGVRDILSASTGCIFYAFDWTQHGYAKPTNEEKSVLADALREIATALDQTQEKEPKS
tara:strand:+ start:239 stop:493 length:255 start_codon:yes stop_codon:yes gene_type:complete